MTDEREALYWHGVGMCLPDCWYCALEAAPMVVLLEDDTADSTTARS